MIQWLNRFKEQSANDIVFKFQRNHSLLLCKSIDAVGLSISLWAANMLLWCFPIKI